MYKEVDQKQRKPPGKSCVETPPSREPRHLRSRVWVPVSGKIARAFWVL